MGTSLQAEILRATLQPSLGGSLITQAGERAGSGACGDKQTEGFLLGRLPEALAPQPPLGIFGIFVQIDFDVGSGDITLFIFTSPNAGPAITFVLLYDVQCFSFNY